MESSSDLVLTFVVVLDHVHKRSIFCTPMSLTGPNYLTYTCISWPRYDRWCTGGHWIQMNYFSRCQGNLSPEKIEWSFQKLTRTSLRNVSYKYFHQQNLYKIKTSKNPDPCYGCVLVTVFIGCVNRGCIGGACLSSIGDLPCVRPSDGVYDCMSWASAVRGFGW